MRYTAIFRFENGQHIIADSLFCRGEVIDFARRLARKRNCAVIVDDHGKRYMVLLSGIMDPAPDGWQLSNE